MDAFTSVTHPSSCSSAFMGHNFQRISHSRCSVAVKEEAVTWRSTAARSPKRRRSLTYFPATRLAIRSAATKPSKSPAEEDWSIKRAKLVEKRVRSVDPKEALRLQNENSFVILDVRPEAEFNEKIKQIQFHTILTQRPLNWFAPSEALMDSIVYFFRRTHQELSMWKYIG
ncbi:unnamed protein product [Cuscuta epithymum]|uniref:Rhodanese domain-containing protein n=1 Tax=Cuscuta epithymum TaxID=186058 RepID=A0AAV0FZD5_9ASTE|nr:unnamed protein product [Cuscuta epithymum]